jgi:peptidoglycan/LPS O-acetylase OafA/YrhL
MGSLVFAVPSALVSYWIVEQSLRQRDHKSRGQLTPPTIA